MQRVIDWITAREKACPSIDVSPYPFERDKDYEAWKESRFDFVGASTIPAIVSLNHYKSPNVLWKQYKERKSTYADNPHTIAGHWNEPLVQFLCEQVSGEYHIHPYNKSHIGKEGWNSATPDGLCTHLFYDELTVNEVKLTSAKKDLDTWLAGEVPEHVECQNQWQMGVCGLKRGLVTAVVQGNFAAPVIREIEFDAEYYNWLLYRGEEFLNCVKKGEKPGKAFVEENKEYHKNRRQEKCM